jgi:hypothetical protein
MKILLRSLCGICVVLLSFVACDSGTWVDGTFLVSCEVQAEVAKADPVKAAEAKKGMEFEAHAICGKAGKAFTGDIRCQNGAGQVKCK